jgi:hypothetical protein
MHQQKTRRAHRHRQWPALAAISAACLLAACGGGGSSTPGANPPVVASTIITGNVGNGSGAPVADATVSLGTTSGTPATTQTDTSGNFTLPVPTADVNTSTVVVVTIAKDGHKTCTGTVNVANGTVAGCETLPLAAPDELHPAPADAVLVRLGDGEISGGAANSKLQIAPPLGLSKTVALPWPANLDPAAFQTFTLNLNIRGMQSFDCADKITVLQGANAQMAAEVQAFSAATNSLADSDSQGGFSAYALQIPAAMFSVAGGNVYVKLEAGLCASGTPADPSDDYEFVGLYGKFS